MNITYLLYKRLNNIKQLKKIALSEQNKKTDLASLIDTLYRTAVDHADEIYGEFRMLSKIPLGPAIITKTFVETFGINGEVHYPIFDIKGYTWPAETISSLPSLNYAFLSLKAVIRLTESNELEEFNLTKAEHLEKLGKQTITRLVAGIAIGLTAMLLNNIAEKMARSLSTYKKSIKWGEDLIEYTASISREEIVNNFITFLKKQDKNKEEFLKILEKIGETVPDLPPFIQEYFRLKNSGFIAVPYTDFEPFLKTLINEIQLAAKPSRSEVSEEVLYREINKLSKMLDTSILNLPYIGLEKVRKKPEKYPKVVEAKHDNYTIQLHIEDAKLVVESNVNYFVKLSPSRHSGGIMPGKDYALEDSYVINNFKDAKQRRSLVDSMLVDSSLLMAFHKLLDELV